MRYLCIKSLFFVRSLPDRIIGDRIDGLFIKELFFFLFISSSLSFYDIHCAFEKFPDWLHYKTIKSAAAFVLLSVRSSYSPLSIDMISSVGLNIYMKI